MPQESSVVSLGDIVERLTSLEKKDDVLAALCSEFNPGEREKSIRRFVNYFYAHEKQRGASSLTREELEFMVEKCQIALGQKSLVQFPRTKKLHAARDLKESTQICGSHNTRDDHTGTRGWVNGWNTCAKDVQIDIELDEPMFVTKMMIRAHHATACPRSMELYAKDDDGEWVLVREFLFRDRRFDGYYGRPVYNSSEMFYVLGHASNQKNFDNEVWRGHPLAGPGQVTGGDPDFYMSSKHWKFRIVESNGADYVLTHDLHLYGRKAVLPAPKDVKSVSFETGARISWELQSNGNAQYSNVAAFHVIAYPGGFSCRSCGGFYEECNGKRSFYDFLNLSSETEYQFQVVAVDAEGNDGIPSRATPPITVNKWSMTEKKHGVKRVVSAIESEEFERIAPTILDGSGIPCVLPPKRAAEYPNTDEAFKRMLRGDFVAIEQLSNSNTITLYISGSLEDTSVERKYISKYAIPTLELWCQANGYDFTGIDLRWGLASEVVNDHQTYTIHIKEMERMYQDSTLAVFCYISGEKYGSTLLPDAISKEDGDNISAEIKDSLKWVVNVAYYLDENGDPPVYKLRKISEINACQRSRFWNGADNRGVHSLMKEIMTVMTKSATVSEKLKQWQPSLAMAECEYALDMTCKSKPAIPRPRPF